MPTTLIDYYKAIEDGSLRMLEAAKLSDWDEVVRYEGVCAVLIERLRHQFHQHKLAPQQRREKTRIMLRILENDAQLRILAEPWIAQLDHFSDRSLQLLH